MIESIIANNDRQRQLGTLATDQVSFQNKIEELKQSILSVRLTKEDGNTVNLSLWD